MVASFFWQAPIVSASILADGTPVYASPVQGGTPKKLDNAVLYLADFIAPQPGNSESHRLGQRRVSGDLDRETDQTGPARGKRRSHVIVARSSCVLTRLVAGRQPAGLFRPGGRGDVGGGEPAFDALLQRRIWFVEPTTTTAASSGVQSPYQLTHTAGLRDEFPRWTHDGQHIVFVRLTGGDRTSEWITASIWVVDVDGNPARQLVAELTPAPAWFGYYGHTDWADLFDLYNGAHDRLKASSPVNLPVSHSSQLLPWTE